ncbi:hypothetical protein BN381_360013 [Candidatus Microthrix parvicella RN1]|uniref:Uncharacterized protein n=1 Tax=Candidatus Neomicrothrix parvicella RN1 TaxID=1229780 RepID=R4Z4W7_9ACTN|nr:hypothetical protein BN381_360013 [Candidatus Microthrix parvicella RN1]
MALRQATTATRACRPATSRVADAFERLDDLARRVIEIVRYSDLALQRAGTPRLALIDVGHQTGHRSAIAPENDSLPLLNSFEQAREVRLGLMYVHNHPVSLVRLSRMGKGRWPLTHAATESARSTRVVHLWHGYDHRPSRRGRRADLGSARVGIQRTFGRHSARTAAARSRARPSGSPSLVLG